MNPGTAPGFGPGVVAGTISRYIQTPLILTSQTIAVPPGTQRIEALLVGGGGAGQGYNGAQGGGGGFGGAAIIEIPVTGSPLQIVIGAGGTPNTGNDNNNTAGSPTYVVSAGTRYAEVGGGGRGQCSNIGGTYYAGGTGRSGGSGGGLNPWNGVYNNGAGHAGDGGGPPIGKLLWSIYPQIAASSVSQASTSNNYANPVGPTVAGLGGQPYGGGFPGLLGGGAGGGYYGGPGPGGGGGKYCETATFGGGSVAGYLGGSLTSVTIWGYTGYAGAASGGGGGLFGAASGVTGGLGGGGGGSGTGTALDAGAGGAGAAVIRFYL